MVPAGNNRGAPQYPHQRLADSSRANQHGAAAQELTQNFGAGFDQTGRSGDFD